MLERIDILIYENYYQNPSLYHILQIDFEMFIEKIVFYKNLIFNLINFDFSFQKIKLDKKNEQTNNLDLEKKFNINFSENKNIDEIKGKKKKIIYLNLKGKFFLMKNI
jgi:hypothetical protein